MLASTPNILQMCSFDANKSTKGASKLRRDLINAEIANLRDLLPLPSSTRQRLSQLQLMALVCVYVRKANYFHHVFRKQQLPPEVPMPHFGFSKALSGFLMMMTQNGKLLYISDNAAEYLGHSMEDLLIHGDSVYDIIEKQDHQVIQAELMRTPSPLNLVPDTRSFLCRMNVSRNARRQMRFGDQKVVLVQGHFVSFLPLCSRNEPVFLATCTPVAMPETRECVVQGSTSVFTSIHSMDMKFMHIDRNGEFHLNYSKSRLQGVSWYEVVHWEHLREAQSKHRLITQSEQERSCILLLRLQTGCGKWIWTHAVLQVKDGADSSQQPVIVCTNQVLSEREASVMRANTWLYQFYSLHSKMHYGLAYEAQSAAAAAAATAPRLPTPYYSTILPFHPPPPPPPPPPPVVSESASVNPYHLNGAQSVFHYGPPPHQGPLHATPYGTSETIRWQSLKRPASPDQESEEPCKSSYVLPSRPSSGYVYPGSGPLNAGPLSVAPLTAAVAASGYFGTSGTQILSSVPYPHLGRYRSHKSSVSEDEVTDLEQSLTPTNTEDVSNMISGYGRYQSYLVGPTGLYVGASSPGTTRRIPDTLDMVFRRDEPFYETEAKVRYQTLEPVHESDKTWVSSPRYCSTSTHVVETRDYRVYGGSGKTSPYPVFEELHSRTQGVSRASSIGTPETTSWTHGQTEVRHREPVGSGCSSDSEGQGLSPGHHSPTVSDRQSRSPS